MHGHKLPEKSVKRSELVTIKQLNISNNPIEIVEFKNIKNKNGTLQIGYFKKINEKKGLPEILGKISVATSALLGKTKNIEGVAEEQLVYDEEDKIVGTVSIELPGFVQFQGRKDEELKDIRSQELANPSPEMILKAGFIKKMVAGLIHHNYDFGPHNCGLHWLLDFEYFFPELTSIFKGERTFFGFSLVDPIEKVIELTQEILRTFKSRLPYFPGESPKNHVGKREFKTTAFKELLDNEKYTPEAIYQRYSAFLEELVLFDPKVIKKHLEDYLGDEKLNLDQLPKEQLAALQKLEQTHLREKKLYYLKDAGIDFSLLCLQKPNESEKLFKKRLALVLQTQEKLLNLETVMPEKKLINLLKKIHIDFTTIPSAQRKKLNAFRKCEVSFPKLLSEGDKEKSFVDFFLTFISHRHEKFRRVIIDMPELRDHLAKLKTPEQFASIFAVKTENGHEAKEIFSRYQKIVSDAFKETILTYIEALKKTASEEIGFSEIIIPKEKIIELSMSCASIDASPYIKKPKKSHLKDEIHQSLQELVGAIKTKYQAHYALEKPNAEKNKTFVDDLTELLKLTQNKKAYYEQLISTQKMNKIELVEIAEIFQKLNKILLNFHQTLIEYKDILSFVKTNQKKLEKTCLGKLGKKEESSKNLIEENTESLEEDLADFISLEEQKESGFATSDEKLILTLKNILQVWLPMPPQFIDSIIKKSYDEYNSKASYARIWVFGKSRSLDSFDLTTIFSSGGWKNNSMNTLLMKNICLAASGTTIMKTVLEGKDKNWWAQYAKELAIASNLYDPKEKPILSKSAII